MEIKGSNVPDKNGSPLNVSAVVTYKVTDPLAALFNVDKFGLYIKSQGQEVVKRVISRFSYMSNVEGEPTLLDDTMIIGKKVDFLTKGKCMKELLQAKVDIAGAQILRMELMEFSYQQEMAQALLQVQQAQAKIDARKLIVEGGVLIVKDALKKLDEQGVDLDEDVKDNLTKEMMLITCAEGGNPSAVINI